MSLIYFLVNYSLFYRNSAKTTEWRKKYDLTDFDSEITLDNVKHFVIALILYFGSWYNLVKTHGTFRS